MIGGLFIYMLPKHIWGKVPMKELTSTYQPQLPMVGSGPFIVTKFDKGRILTLERNPEFRGPAPKYEKVEFIKYGNQDAVERALQVGEVDLDIKVSSGNFKRLGEEGNIETLKASSPPTRSWRSTSARKNSAPTRSATRRCRTKRCARRSATR